MLCLQRGFDTVEANTVLGFADDCRQYDCVLPILDSLGLKSIRLLTNNPMKIDQLSTLGVRIAGRIPVLIDSNPHSDKYLRVKASRMGHLFE